MNITENDKAFISNLKSLSSLYEEVKLAFALAENLDKDQSTYIQPINELRNTFDHLMRSFQFPQRMEHEFNEAKEHLYRAAYDVYEILAMDLISKISTDLKYDSSIISLIYPAYYNKRKPEITQIQIELAELRSKKKIDPETNNKKFDKYMAQITKLIDISKEISHLIPDLETEKAKNINNNKRDIWVNISIATASVILGAFLTYLFS